MKIANLNVMYKDSDTPLSISEKENLNILLNIINNLQNRFRNNSKKIDEDICFGIRIAQETFLTIFIDSEGKNNPYLYMHYGKENEYATYITHNDLKKLLKDYQIYELQDKITLNLNPEYKKEYLNTNQKEKIKKLNKNYDKTI